VYYCNVAPTLFAIVVSLIGLSYINIEQNM